MKERRTARTESANARFETRILSCAQPAAPLAVRRGRRVGAQELAEFVNGLDIGDAAKQRLLALTPAGYAGLADRLVDLLR